MGDIQRFGTPWSALAEDWAIQAGENVEKWGRQDIETLLLAAQEELGELTQAHLEAEHETGDRARVSDELGDLAALLFQIQWTMEFDRMEVSD